MGAMSDGGAAGLEAKRQSDIQQGLVNIDQSFAGFTPDWYKNRAQDYIKAETPDVMRDYQETKNNLTYALARHGILNSSAAVQRDTSLQKKLAENQSTIANGAQDSVNRLKANVQQQKGQLTTQLESSADPTGVTAQALGAAAGFRADSPIQPLGNLFADWSQQYLGSQTAAAYAPQENVWSQLANKNTGTPNAPGGSSTWTN